MLGTDHAAEALTGFYTKYGDGGSDLVPIFRLNKRQGRKILKELGCPEHLYLKIPTADLEDDRPLLPDEVALGVSYEEIDDYLEGKKVYQHQQQQRIQLKHSIVNQLINGTYPSTFSMTSGNNNRKAKAPVQRRTNLKASDEIKETQ